MAGEHWSRHARYQAARRRDRRMLYWVLAVAIALAVIVQFTVSGVAALMVLVVFAGSCCMGWRLAGALRRMREDSKDANRK